MRKKIKYSDINNIISQQSEIDLAKKIPEAVWDSEKTKVHQDFIY